MTSGHEVVEKLVFPIEMVANVLRTKKGETLELMLNYVLLLSDKDDAQLLQDSIVDELLSLSQTNNDRVGQLALNSVINISGTEAGSRFLAQNANVLLKLALDQESTLSNQACNVLSNMTRFEDLAVKVSQVVISTHALPDLVHAISNKSYNKAVRLDNLAQLLGNLTQSVELQKCLVGPVDALLQRVLPVLSNGVLLEERKGIASVLYNILLDRNCHMALLEPPFEILPVLLLPLAGGETFDDEDYDKMPVELQYLPDDKKREESGEVRNLLLRSLLLLCCLKPPRTFVRDHNSYFILRELHKWEKDKENLLAAEKVIDILIRTEEEIGVDDISSVEVPDDLKEKFEKWDKDFVQDE